VMIQRLLAARESHKDDSKIAVLTGCLGRAWAWAEDDVVFLLQAPGFNEQMATMEAQLKLAKKVQADLTEDKKVGCKTP